MINLPSIAEKALGVTLEGVWSVPLKLTAPNGVEQNVRGQLVYKSYNIADDSRGIAQGGRQSIFVKSCTVSLRESSLNPCPVDGEHWAVTIPVSPQENADTQIMYMESAVGGVQSTGFVTLYLEATK